MLFTSAILAFVTFSNAIQVAIPVDAFNQKLIESLPQINSILSKKLIQLDPIPDSGSGSASSSQGMLFCTARVSADFHLKNLRGISGVSVSLFQISSIVADQGTGSFTVAFTLKTNRDIDGRVFASCGKIHNSAGINGNVKMEEFQVNAVGTGIIAGGEQLTLTSITVENVDSDVDRVRVSINNMGGVFNPVVGAVTSSMQNTLKYKVRTLANKEVKSRITEALTFVLPIVVPL